MYRRDQRGFTLVEIMLAVVILATAGGLALQALTSANTSFMESKVRQQVNEDARKMMEVITKDIREAGFGAVLNDLGNVSANPYFESAFDDIWSGTDGVSDGIILRGVKLGTEISSEMPPSSSELKVKNVDAFQPYSFGYALVYQNGEFQILHLTKVQDSAKHLQHNKDKTKFKIPVGAPVYRLDEIKWQCSDPVADPNDDSKKTVTVTRRVNAFFGYIGDLTHTFTNVRSLNFNYVLTDGSVVSEIISDPGNSNYNANKLMCVEVNLVVFRMGGRNEKYRSFEVRLSQRVAPRNL